MDQSSGLTVEQLHAVLLALAPGEPLGLPALESASGVPAAAIEAGLEQLVDHGVRRRRDGRLRVPGGIEFLEAGRIESKLRGRLDVVPELEVLAVTGSSNDVARVGIESGAGSPRVILAEAQTAGRGRRGRAWASPVAANLYLSQVERLQAGLESARGLSLVAGVAVADAIEEMNGTRVELKWPNDLVVEGRKLGGILVELVTRGDLSHAVIGIGVNVSVPAYVGRRIDQPWIDLRSLAGAAVPRNELAAAVIAHLGRAMATFRREGLSPQLRRAWQARDPYRGRRVLARWETGELRGTAEGIDQTGALVIDTPSGRVALAAGEVSLRLEGDA